MIKIVIDTNILISALGWKEGNPRKILKLCIEGKCLMITSPDLINEFISVMGRPKFDFISKEEKNEFILHLFQVSYLVEPKSKIDKIKQDPMDNIVLEAALEGKVNYIVSGDSHLLDLKRFRNIKIISTKNFLDLIQ